MTPSTEGSAAESGARPARVTMVTASVTRAGGGLAPIVLDLTRALRKTGRAVDTLSTRDRFWTDAPGAGEAFPPRGPAAISGPLAYAPGLGRRLGELAPDVAHTHGLWRYSSSAVLRWCDRTGRPRVVSPHGMLDPWALRRGRRKKAIIGRLFERRHTTRADCLHALSPAERDAAREFGVRGPICVIPNGVDLAAPRPTVSPPWGDAEGRRVLLFLGRVHPKKGIDLLLEAWPRAAGVEPRLREWHLAVVGWDDGGHADALRRRAAALDLGDAVGFYGPAFGDVKAAAFASAAAFVLPSHSEGMPVAALEAWSYGLPTVLTPQCNLGIGFTEGGAVRVDPDIDSLARGLAGVAAADDAEFNQRGRRALALVERRFSWRAVTEQFGAVYDWLAGAGARPGCVEVS